METTISKRLKGEDMEIIFNNSEIVNIRYYKAILKEKDYFPNKTYLFEIKIRHNEEEDPEKLFLKAKKQIVKN